LGLQRLTAAVDRNAVLIDVQPIRRTTVASNPDDWGFRIGRIYLTITARCSPRIASKGIDNGVLAASRLGVNSVPTRSAKNVKVGFAALPQSGRSVLKHSGGTTREESEGKPVLYSIAKRQQV
jgi:hypothetical protein